MRSTDMFAACAKRSKPALAALLLGSGLVLGQPASATIVQVQTSLGDFQINLYDKGTPLTVANFLAYINASAYTDSVVHRSEPGFVIQGGGFKYQTAWPLVAITERPKVANEPVYSNIRGTIAMAKLGSDPNSATSQWFISLADNSQNLDVQNGGFTVFGQVTASGMAVVDAIAAVSRFNLGGAVFTALPLRNYTSADATAGTLPTDNNLVMIRSVTVVDSNPDSAISLNPARNTLINAPPANGGESGGGGSLGLAGLLALGLLVVGRVVLARTPRASANA